MQSNSTFYCKKRDAFLLKLVNWFRTNQRTFVSQVCFVVFNDLINDLREGEGGSLRVNKINNDFPFKHLEFYATNVAP